MVRSREILLQTVRPSTRLRSELGRLPDAERRVAELVLGGPGEAMHDSVGQLAGRAGVSPATVIRLSRRIGYDGFAALKIAIAQETGSANHFGHPVPEGGSSAALHIRVMAADAESIQRAARSVETGRFARSRMAIVDAHEVLFAGVGGSTALAALAAFRFSALGVRTSAPMDVLSQHLRAATLSAGDVCVAISHTGESKDTIEIATTANQARATTVAITSFAGSPLTEAADIALVCGDEIDTAAQELFANPVALVSVLGALHADVSAHLPRPAAPGTAARLIATHQY
jgi:RpiR family transcriptional regulator, carbohydrate utilization regulator